MELFGFSITRKKATPPLAPAVPMRGGGGWYPLVRESFPGAWQQNVTIAPDTVLSYGAVFSCVTTIASDISKLDCRLVAQDAYGVWTDTTNPAFTPVLRKPNRYQNPVTFFQTWMVSKLINGNAYMLKERDGRGVVTALYVLDPWRCWPLVAPDGSVYYSVGRDPLAQLAPDDLLTANGLPAIPASEIIHDLMVPLYHPLVGVSPIYACGTAALQGLAIQQNSQKFFINGSAPGGILTAPGHIDDSTAARIKEYWDTNFTGDNVGKVAVLGDALKYESLSVNAVDAQLIDQLRWTGEDVARCFHMPAYMIGIGPPPTHVATTEALMQQYYAQCLQVLLTAIETCLDDGLGLTLPINGTQYGTEFDLDDLIWMDTATRTKAASDGIGSGALSPNEARAKYFGLGPVPGGETPYLQEQNWPLQLLADRELPSQRPPTPPAALEPPEPAEPAEPLPPAVKHLAAGALARRAAELLRKTLERAA
jgi:HK97 family phage portal protein